MQYTLRSLFTASALMAGIASSQGQTVATLDDLTLPGTDTSFSTTQALGQAYGFQSGNATFFGQQEFWGGLTGFDYSNHTDVSSPGYWNDKCAITGKGHNNSDNYAVAYVQADWPARPTYGMPVSARLENDAKGNLVAGFYVTNTTYAYNYINDYYQTGDWFKLVVQGYLNGALKTDSVVYTLASFETSGNTLVDSWEWVNLLPLGQVDSLTFYVYSSDEFTPFYFALDDLTTMDGVCSTPMGFLISSINETSATFSWTAPYPELVARYEIAIDQSLTLTPDAGTTIVDVAETEFTQDLLDANTSYIAHYRSKCIDGGYSDWDTIAFQTLDFPNGIATPGKDALAISLSPNPAKDAIAIHSTLPSLDVQISDINGRVIFSQKSHRGKISIAQWTNGVYILKASDPESGLQVVKKFIKY